MPLEANLLIKRSPRRVYHFFTARRIAFIMGIIMLITLVICNRITITEKQFTEYQVMVQSYLGEKEDKVTIVSTNSPMISILLKIPTLNYELKDKQQLEAEFLRRGDHVKEKCKELGLMEKRNYVPMSNAQEFFINYDYHLLYCSVFEAAATSWLYNMNLLTGFTPDYLTEAFETYSPVTFARKKYRRPSQSKILKALDENLSFLIVRHPFSRLVSTYWKTFILNTDDKFNQDVGLKIIERTRILADVNLQKDGRINQTELSPTFEELVRFTLCEWRDNKLQDNDWRPMNKFCTPCQFPFDYIIKFESLEEEQEVLIERANLQDVLKPRWEEEGSSSSPKIEDLEREYFSHLSKRQILELYEYYKADFELFEYSIEKYLAYGQDLSFVSLPCQKLSKT